MAPTRTATFPARATWCSAATSSLAETPPAASAAPAFELTASRQFTAWLAEQRLALACTTYQAGKLFLLGLQPDGRLALFERSFDRPMGLCVPDRQLYLSTLYQLWRFDDALEPGQAHQGHDRLYVPQLAWTTGDSPAWPSPARATASRP